MNFTLLLMLVIVLLIESAKKPSTITITSRPPARSSLRLGESTSKK